MKISFSTILPALAFVAAATACGDEDFTIISAIGDDTASLADTVDAFKLLLGGVDNLSNPAVAEGFRTINWDAPFVPFEMPGDFFAVNVTRGLSIGSEENEFRVSNPPDDSDNLFDSINPYASQDFSTFSPPRLFSPIKNKKIEITFSPAAQVPAHAATVKGFGAIFVDVDFPDTTKMTALDVDGCEIFSGYVPPNDNGLSFLSIAFRESIIKTIVIKLGDAKLNSDCDEGNGGRDDDDKKSKGGKMGGKKGGKKSDKSTKGPSSSKASTRRLRDAEPGEERQRKLYHHDCDVVVLDDFIYGEPIEIIV